MGNRMLKRWLHMLRYEIPTYVRERQQTIGITQDTVSELQPAVLRQVGDLERILARV